MLNKNISIVKYKQILAEQQRKETEEYIDKLNTILNNPATYFTNRVTDIVKLYDYIDDNNEKRIKRTIDRLYTSLNTKRRNK